MRLLYQVLHAGLHPPRMMAPWYATLRELTWDRRKGDAWVDGAPEDYWVLWRGYGESEKNEELEWKQISLRDLEVLRLEEDMIGQPGEQLEALIAAGVRGQLSRETIARKIFKIEELGPSWDDDDGD